MTDDMRRVINILADWLIIKGQGSEGLFEATTVKEVIYQADEHGERLCFALGLAFGVDSQGVPNHLESWEGRTQLEEFLRRCRRVFINS